MLTEETNVGCIQCIMFQALEENFESFSDDEDPEKSKERNGRDNNNDENRSNNNRDNSNKQRSSAKSSSASDVSANADTIAASAAAATSATAPNSAGNTPAKIVVGNGGGNSNSM